MPSRRRTIPLIAAALVALMALAVIVPRHGALPSRGTARTGTPESRQGPSAPEPTTPDVGLLAAQNLDYAPGLDVFAVEPFLRSIGSDLGDYVVEQGARRVAFGDLVASAAERHAVNPRVLLVLLELATGVVSTPSPDRVMAAAGYPAELAPDVEAQIERLAATLSSHYVAAFMGDEPVAAQGPDGSPFRVAAVDPAPVAIARTLAEVVPPDVLGAAVSGPRPEFGDLYRQWFGDPREIPAFAQGVVLPADAAWPFEGVKRHTGGPHLGAFCSQQDILAASGLDFGGESHEVLAMADGRYLGRGETTAGGLQAGKYVLLEHAGGVQVMYWHLGGFSPEVQALAPGAEIPKGFPVGWSGRSGNQSAVHLHVELRRGAVPTNPYSGVRVPWDGQVVDGWTVRMFRWPGHSDRGISYRGSAVRGASRVLAITNCTCDLANAEVVVSGGHPGTSAPRNGMDADTVLANYPDVGLLASSNRRTTVLWSTRERVWRHRLSWYYLIDASSGTVTDVSLDGAPLFAAPQCARATWLGAGEHRLTWRHREGEGAGSAVRITPWPFALPDCAAPAVSAAPEGDVPPASPHDDAMAVGGVRAAATGAVGSSLTATWHLRNTGTTRWGEGYRLVFGDGWPLGSTDDMPLPAAGPGQEVTVTLPVTVPLTEGTAHSAWRLRNPQGAAFGPLLTADVGAPPAAVDAPAGASPGELSAPLLLEPVAEEGDVAFVAGREVTLRWIGPAEAEGYVLHVSLTPTPADDAHAVFRERLGATVGERRLIFADDVPLLYWQVTAIGRDGDVASRVAAFGLDTVAPTCSVAAAPDGEAVARVAWEGQDAISGIAAFDVAYRAADETEWRPLATAVAGVREAPIVGPRGRPHAVRCRARDVAGNVGAWSAEAVVGHGGEAAQARVAGEGLVVTALPGSRLLLVEAPVRNVGTVGGDVRLSLVVESGQGSPETVHRWDVVGLAAGGAVTLTAAIDAPTAPASVGEALDAGLRFSVQSRDDAGTELAAVADVCLATPDPYEAWDASDGGQPLGAPLQPGWRQTRGFHAPWDIDRAQVPARSGAAYRVWLDDAAPHAILELYDPAGDLVASGDGTGGPDGGIGWTAATDGTYRIVVRPWAPGSEGCDTGYTLRLQSVPAAPEVPEGAVHANAAWLPTILAAEAP